MRRQKMNSAGGGAIAMIGPDMNIERNSVLPEFEIISNRTKSCGGLIDLTINNQAVKELFSCYKFRPNQYDHLGLEEYTKLKNARNEYYELQRKCPCLLNADVRLPESRDKRSVKDDSLLGIRDADGFVHGCEDEEDIGANDVWSTYNDYAYFIKNQRECKKKFLIEILLI
uniref:Uncharacterized protein n=1 Tax=Meloidogyne hapla TaxID=6305 RepID=A0A1I8BTG0_MELHA